MGRAERPGRREVSGEGGREGREGVPVRAMVAILRVLFGKESDGEEFVKQQSRRASRRIYLNSIAKSFSGWSPGRQGKLWRACPGFSAAGLISRAKRAKLNQFAGNPTAIIGGDDRDAKEND